MVLSNRYPEGLPPNVEAGAAQEVTALQASLEDLVFLAREHLAVHGHDLSVALVGLTLFGSMPAPTTDRELRQACFMAALAAVQLAQNGSTGSSSDDAGVSG